MCQIKEGRGGAGEDQSPTKCELIVIASIVRKLIKAWFDRVSELHGEPFRKTSPERGMTDYENTDEGIESRLTLFWMAPTSNSIFQ
jgi:hypothetical protein